MKLSGLLLVLLTQFSDCAGRVCSLDPEDAFDARRVAVAIRSVEEVAPLGEDDFVVTSMVHPTGMAVARVRGGREESVAATPALFPYDLSPSVYAAERGWWFSRQGQEGNVSRVFFAVGGAGDDAVRQTRVVVPRSDRAVWLPVRGSEARGMYVAIDEERHELVVTAVMPAGLTAMGAFPWPEDGAMRTLENDRWSAEPLGGGRIAIIGIDAVDEATLQLRIVGGAEPREAAIPCAERIAFPFDTAVDASGRVSVVGLSEKRDVVAMLVDADQPRSARCRVISAPGERAARPGFGTPSVAWTGAAFVAGWIGEDGSVRACELGDLRTAPAIVDVAEDADVERPLRQLVYGDGELVTFVWKQRGGDIMRRRLPATLSGYAFAADVWRAGFLRRWCSR